MRNVYTVFIQQKYRSIKISSLPVLGFRNLQYTALQWLNVLLLLVRDNEHTPKIREIPNRNILENNHSKILHLIQ